MFSETGGSHEGPFVTCLTGLKTRESDWTGIRQQGRSLGSAGGPRSGQENGRTPVVTPPADKQRGSETQEHTSQSHLISRNGRELTGGFEAPHCCQSYTVRFNKDHYVVLGVEHNILEIYHGNLLFVIDMQMFGLFSVFLVAVLFSEGAFKRSEEHTSELQSR